ncbi:MAG: hypothetical protein OET90_11475 [Desulfuromonadales bacterium]|nr:hypothetical protein [Desulfuromonadales bacterium]
MEKKRYLLLRLAGVKIGQKCLVWSPLIVRPVGGASNICIGERCFLNTEIRFGCPGKITIGDRVQIGPRVSFETASHGLKYEPGRGRGTIIEPITIGDEVWIGAGVTVLQGVTIEKGAVICAGAVVNQDVPAGAIAGGVPARIIRMVDES